MKERHYFGTDGIRGKANSEPMTADIALTLGKTAVIIIIFCLISKSSFAQQYESEIKSLLMNQHFSGSFDSGTDIKKIGEIKGNGFGYLI